VKHECGVWIFNGNSVGITSYAVRFVSIMKRNYSATQIHFWKIALTDSRKCVELGLYVKKLFEGSSEVHVEYSINYRV
jgi:hypothetical protein